MYHISSTHKTNYLIAICSRVGSEGDYFCVHISTKIYLKFQMCVHLNTEIWLPVTWKIICKIVTLAWHFWTRHSSQCPQQAKLFYFITSISTFSLPTLKSPTLLSDLSHFYFLTALLISTISDLTHWTKFYPVISNYMW